MSGDEDATFECAACGAVVPSASRIVSGSILDFCDAQCADEWWRECRGLRKPLILGFPYRLTNRMRPR